MEREGEGERRSLCCICRRKRGKESCPRVIVRPYADPSRGYCPDCYGKIMKDYGLATAIERFPELRRVKRKLEPPAGGRKWENEDS